MAKNPMKVREVKSRTGCLHDMQRNVGRWKQVEITFHLINFEASPVRKAQTVTKLTGRPRGYMRVFGISRNVFRKMALEKYQV